MQLYDALGWEVRTPSKNYQWLEYFAVAIIHFDHLPQPSNKSCDKSPFSAPPLPSIQLCVFPPSFPSSSIHSSFVGTEDQSYNYLRRQSHSR